MSKTTTVQERKKKEKVRKLKEKGYIPIREVSKLAGVQKSLIHFYVNQKLLPRPVKVSKQMAYYPPDTVERIKFIKKLQKRYLPIKEIKRILKNSKSIEDVKNTLIKIDSRILEEYNSKQGKQKEEPILPIETVRELEKIGIIDKRNSLFREEILEIISRLRDIGLNEKNGFSVKFLKNYIDVCKKLVELEFQEFNSKMIGKVDAEKLVEIAKVSIDEVSELIKILHKKFLLEKLKEIQ
ncbi:MAG: MerR family transcriptional regulator [Candidatus Calescibacterium sp.]|nr:MerR family transcriptional regulator [Candidatus Calescibacterium sp.]MCX7733795.1 MerR family transcriptional regulator [bacterium]MDW8086999.1 MerR family transcriptional regulator [Candidatus Calescibacterium sp.]